MNPKPGYKTTEFWLTVATSVVSFVVASGVQNDTVVQMVATATGVLAAMGYTVSRTMMKAKTNENV